MVYIPGGEFSMGSLDPTEMVCGGDQPMDDARPLHRVYVDPFLDGRKPKLLMNNLNSS